MIGGIVLKRKLSTISMDMPRAFYSINFLIASIGICIVYYVSAWQEINPKADMLSVFLYAPLSLGPLITLFYVLPYTTSYCSDWNSQYIRFIAIRTGSREYALSKTITCALSSGTAIVLGNVLFILLLMQRHISVSTSLIANYVTRTIGGEFLIKGQYGVYFAMYIYLMFLSAAFWSVVGLLASSYIPNKFVALCTPFIIDFSLRRVTYTLPVWLRLNRISEGMCIIKGTWISLAYATLVYTVLTAVVGFLFVKNAKRRLSNG